MLSPAIPAHTTHEFAGKTSDACIVVCVLDEGKRIERQIGRMQALKNIADIILVDGGSSDGATTPEMLRGKIRTLLVKSPCEPRGLSVQLKVGLHYALEQGYEYIVSIDGNGKDGVEAAPQFIAALREGCDLVQGSRFLPGGGHAHTPLDRIIGIRFLFTPLMNLFSGFAYTDAMNGFKGLRASLLRDARVQPFRPCFRRYNLQYYLNYRAPRLGMRVKEIPVTRDYPASGPTPSKITGLPHRLHILAELAGTLLGRYNPP